MLYFYLIELSYKKNLRIDCTFFSAFKDYAATCKFYSVRAINDVYRPGRVLDLG